MHALIVSAHPEPQSFTARMGRFAARTLEEAGHTVSVSDLYAMRFNPVGGRHDFSTRLSEAYFSYEGEQRHAHERSGFSPDLAAEQAKLESADLLLFVCPLWWHGLPAILKGWVDRVLAVGFAYGGGRCYAQGVFRGKRALLIVTTGGEEEAYTPEGAHGTIEAILYPIHHGIFQFVGMETLPPFVAYAASYHEEAQKEAVLQALQARLLRIETEPALLFPGSSA